MDTVLQTTAERLTDTLSRDPWGLHNYAQVVDLTAWLSGLPEGTAKHLNDLEPSAVQVALERVANCADSHALVLEWLNARKAEQQARTTEELNAQAEEWIRDASF